MVTSPANCPICGSDKIIRNKELFDDRYGYNGIYTILKCLHCHHIFTEVKFSESELKDLYSNFYPRKLLDLDKYSPSPDPKGFHGWINGLKGNAYAWVPKNVTVLDIGCGFGETLGYHKSRGCKVYGIEADSNIVRVAEKFKFNVHLGLFTPDIYENNFFDYVTMDQVMEHIEDPVQILTGISRILKPSGKLIISFPNAFGFGAKFFGKRWINWHIPYHLNFYSKLSLGMAAKKAGLKILDIKTITSSEWIYYQWVHLLYFPKPGVPSKFWKPGQNLSLWDRFILKSLFLSHKLMIDHLITRLLDFFKTGDGVIVFMTKNDQ